MRKTTKNFITFFLCTALILSLSGCKKDPEEGDGTDLHDDSVADTLSEDKRGDHAPVSSADNVFTMNYDPDSSLNPLKATNLYNKELFGLLYEGLFAVNSSFEAEKVLCEGWDTSDGVTWVFTLRSDVTFHDGNPLEAEDAVYSINQARLSSNFSSRLSKIESATVTGTYSLKVKLTEANISFPLLLDIPVIKSGSAEDDAPMGTGPYELLGTYGQNRLSVYSEHRGAAELPLDTIYLKKVTPQNIAEEFSGRGLDILNYDPTGVQTLNVHLEYETRYYDTSTLLYLGFNLMTGEDGAYHENAVSDPIVRRAISRLIDRDSICGELYHDAVRRAPLALSSALGYYSADWETETGYSLQAFSALFASAGMEDMNSDGYLESKSGSFKLKIIVNEENPYKVAAAEKIAADLRNTGINTELSILPWEDFIKALSEGDFSIYLAEAKLQQDFDLSPLLSAEGSLNYSGVSEASFSSYIRNFLAAENSDAKSTAARVLCEYIRDYAPIIPIAYKKGAVLTHIGAASGLAPSQSNIFFGISNWNINQN